MKTGLNLVELAKKIQAQQELKQDFIAPVQALSMTVQTDATPVLNIPIAGGVQPYPILPIAHEQIGSHLEIPKKYYDRMLTEAPDLLASNVNNWLAKSADDEKRMVRTLGGDARAFLSNRYNRIENEEIAEVALPVLMNTPGMEVKSCEVTDRRLYIHAVATLVQGEVKRGDVVQAGVIISNSETGHGSVSVSPLVYRLVCLNGLILPDRKFRANHVGRRIDDNEALWRDDTRKADDRAILLKVRDMIAGAVDQVRFAETIAKMAELTGDKIKGDPVKAVEVLSKKISVNEGEQGGILRSLIEGGDLSRWGILNAVTHQAHSASTYDRSVEFEQLGGRVLDLPKSDWTEILEAA
jgi:Domain of unknown function (DUF932)